MERRLHHDLQIALRGGGRLRLPAACALAAVLLAGCAGGSSPSSPRAAEDSPAQKLYREGRLAFQNGNLAEAMERFQASRGLAEKEGSQEDLASSLHAIAMIHVQEGRWREATTHMERVLSLDRKVLEAAKRSGAGEAALHAAEATIANDLYDLARLHRRLGEPEVALARLQEMLAVDLRLKRERGAAITHNNIGRILLALD
ncbi:MAG: tetratricopeptide repeat protein, partial [Candidatus Tectomicrobia bacterium]|nr:tetratricopeptide repeat protein [Candidatus Tectomicrobia bacterium]